MASPPNRLRELRTERGEMVADLAVLVRRESSMISRYETGASEMPLDVVRTLVAHYKVSAEELLGWDREAA